MEQQYKLYNADCLDILPGEYEGKVNLILTSPPYDTLRNYGGIDFDFESVASAITPCLVPGGVLVWIVNDATINGSETCTSFKHALYFVEHCGLNLHDTMIYAKGNGPHTGATNIRYRQAFEYMFVFSNGSPANVSLINDIPARKPGKNFIGGRRKPDGSLRASSIEYVPDVLTRRNIWEYTIGYGHSAEMGVCYEHPAIFPLQLAKDHIVSWSKEGDLVLDPMAGSGTTLRAAVNLGRQAVGIEIEEKYCDIIRTRMQQGVLV